MNNPGLTSSEAERSRHLHGKNTFNVSGDGGFRIFLEVLKEPMVILLIVACTFYFIMGEVREGMIMAFAIILVSGISVFQQVRSEKAVRELGKLTRQQTAVMRDGVIRRLPADDIVVDDLVMYSEGEQVSADASILESNDLSVDESILTGESLPVRDKKTGDLLLTGTTVNSGMAWGRVMAVGSQTHLGKLGKSMEETVKEKTPLQIQVAVFVRRMAYFGVIAFLFVWIYNYLESGDVIHSLMHGLTLAMAVLPEEIPVAFATFMALGAYRMIKNQVLARHPQTVESLGAATIICVDKTGTITENRMSVSAIYDFRTDTLIRESSDTESYRELLKTAMLASEEDPFDPMEKAIHEKYESLFPHDGHYSMIHEYPISGIQPMMTHIYLDGEGKRLIAAKGAPEGLMQLSELSEQEKQKVTDCLELLAGEGNRVLGVGRGVWQKDQFPETQQEFRFEFLGLVALSDPPRKNIPEVIRNFYDSGIDVKMITGDYPQTARSIAERVGLRNSDVVVTGAEISAMTDEVLRKRLKEVTILARVSPEVKLRVINVLKSMGEVVAMTGDGVNDGPALRAAHIGVAMGKRGSEVARQASSLVLINDDLSSMVKAVTFGRSIYSNLKKAIQYIISIHIPLISVVTIPILLGWKFPNLFSPVHVIFLELIMGPTCSIVYENEPVDERLMKRAPRKMSDSLFTWRELSRSVLQGAVITLAMLALMLFLINAGSSETRTRTMVFTSLVISNILLTLVNRSTTDNIFKTIRYKNNLMPLMIGVTVALLAMFLTVDPLMEVFGFEHISLNDLLTCTLVAIAGVMWIEVVKIRFRS